MQPDKYTGMDRGELQKRLGPAPSAMARRFEATQTTEQLRTMLRNLDTLHIIAAAAKKVGRERTS